MVVHELLNNLNTQHNPVSFKENRLHEIILTKSVLYNSHLGNLV